MISEIKEFSKDVLQKNLPELPSDRRDRYIAKGISADDADMYVRTTSLGDFFDFFLQNADGALSPALASNYIASDIAGKIEAGEIETSWLVEENAIRFAALIKLVEGGLLSSRGAKNTLVLMFTHTGDPEVLAKEAGLIQQNDPKQLLEAVQRVIEANPGVVAEYKSGKEASLQFLVGQGMKETKGAGNPTLLREELKKALS